MQEPMRTTQQQQGATTSGSSPNRRRPQRTSAASASKNLKLKQVDLTESEEGQDESEDEKPNEKRLQGRRSGGQRAPLSLQAAQGKKRKRAAVESTSEESSGSGDNFAPEPEEQQESSSSEDDVAQASDSNNASDTDATKRPQPRARSKKSKKSAAPALKANDDESDSDRPLAAAATAASSSKRPYGGTVKHEDNLDMSLRDPFLMAESADDSDLEDGEDLDDLLNELAAMQRGKKRTKTELSGTAIHVLPHLLHHALILVIGRPTEEDRRRMRSETPKETPEEEKARKKREKEYKKSRGSNWNYVSVMPGQPVCMHACVVFANPVTRTTNYSAGRQGSAQAREASPGAGQRVGKSGKGSGHHQAYQSTPACLHRSEAFAFPIGRLGLDAKARSWALERRHA